MRTRRAAFPALFALSLASAAPAQEANAPMSAIDWLSDSVSAPVTSDAAEEPAVNSGAPLTEVAVAPLGSGPLPDALGILSPAVTGLPADLWGASRADDVARRIQTERADMLPALQALLSVVLLAELDAPAGPGADGRSVFLARVDKLLDMGALEQANALLQRAGAADPEIFRRWFDVSLLLGEEQALCEIMSDTPDLSPTYQARIFCLARAGDWNTATLLLGTGSALGLIPDEDADLFARFLDPDLYEDEDPLPLPRTLSPLTFRMFEAIGQAIPTTGLPLAFAHSDLRPNIGWKARIEAGERLARTGAVSDNQLIGLYTERRPAASGGVWSRVEAIQALEAAMAEGDSAAISTALERAWALLTAAELEVPIARVHGPALHALGLPGSAGRIAFRMALLSPSYETVARTARPGDAESAFLAALAQGNVTGLAAPDERAGAVAEGFATTRAPARLASLLTSDRLGEAILRAMTLFTQGISGNLDQVTDALALFRAVGLEDTARRAALQFLILDRRG